MPDDHDVKPVPAMSPDPLSAEASASAPFIYFDGASSFGFNNGVANVTLEAMRFLSIEGKVVRERVVVAHLRMSFAAAMNLRSALNSLALLAAPSGDRPSN